MLKNFKGNSNLKENVKKKILGQTWLEKIILKNIFKVNFGMENILEAVICDFKNTFRHATDDIEINIFNIDIKNLYIKL